MVFIKRSELNEMSKAVIDEDTGMTELDLWEWRHSDDEISIIEDEPDIIAMDSLKRN